MAGINPARVRNIISEYIAEDIANKINDHMERDSYLWISNLQDAIESDYGKVPFKITVKILGKILRSMGWHGTLNISDHLVRDMDYEEDDFE